ncbi:flagellar motility protein MotE (MotC chaperone) [Cytobacillus eiseniae]|uniref:Flagellar motility protein MotE (MotC chaperone) n=1 Tax=Cytobacillus eiseniae TaxID=762947 RepID=A0ABS4RB50_9BACI|nr:flagellar motility protein MotE (MotC chaperone) [Cytobacillus eiseniae]
MDKVTEEVESKKTSRFQSFIYIVLIPLLGAICVTLLVMTYLGYNVFDLTKEYGQKIPFLSSAFSEDTKESAEEMETKMIELEAEIKDREAKIDKLESELKSKDQEISRSVLEKERLEEEIAELTAMKDENKRAFKDIVKTYETISAKKAAPILAQMTEEEAIQILTNLKSDTLAAIMEKMEPEDAARYTELLTADIDVNE